ncbi:MAG: hypothetical protein ACLQK4_05225 [Acidimicrobiales bacterium]
MGRAHEHRAARCVGRGKAPGLGAAALSLAAAALLLAACGGGPTAGVANLGTSSGDTSTPTPPGGNSGSPPSAALQAAQLAYSKCMRAHGVVNFPDPNVGGGYPRVNNLQPDSSSYVNGAKDCRPLADAAQMAPWTKAQMEAHDAMMLKISVCMRAHGITNFPDPNASGGFSAPPGGIDMGSPQYAAAAKKCNGPPDRAAPAGRGN